MQNKISLNSLLLIAISVVGIFIFYYSFQKYLHFGEENKKLTLKITKSAVVNELNALEKKLKVDFRKAENVAESIAKELDNNSEKLDSLTKNIVSDVNENNFSAIGIHFSEKYSKVLLNKGYRNFIQQKGNGNQLISPFFKFDMKKAESFPYDYTDSLSNGKYWYSENLIKGSWTKPYFGPANRNFVLSYRAPIKINLNEDNNSGIVCIDYSLNYIRKVVGELNLLKSGYGIVLNEDNIIISHPVDEYLGKPISKLTNNTAVFALDSIQENQFHDLSAIENSLLKGKLIYKREIEVGTQINTNNTSIKYRAFIILNEKETLIEFGKGGQQSFYQSENSLRIRLIILGVFCLFSIVYLFYRFLNIKNDWVIVGIYSAVSILAICLIWYCHLEFSVNSSFREEIEVTNKTDLEAVSNYFYNNQEKSTTFKEPLKLKTGFFIQSVKFSSATDIVVNGYIWIKSSSFIDEELKKIGVKSVKELGFALPEAQEFDSVVVFSDKELTRWSFSATIRQSFDYSQYPFDDEEIWLRIQVPNFYQNKILLVPDFDSYANTQNEENTLKLNEKKGLENGIFIEGWDIRRTYFSFRKNTYLSNFGTNKSQELQVQPELYYNISIRRNFIGVFVAYMIPILVTAFLLFTVLMINTRNKDKNELLGFNSATVLAFCASLFFVLTVSHMSLRDTLLTNNVIYLEYFFFSLYIALAIISVYSIIFAQSSPTSQLHKDDGRLIKICYWPIFLISILIITSIFFNY